MRSSAFIVVFYAFLVFCLARGELLAQSHSELLSKLQIRDSQIDDVMCRYEKVRLQKIDIAKEAMRVASEAKNDTTRGAELLKLMMSKPTPIEARFVCVESFACRKSAFSFERSEEEVAGDFANAISALGTVRAAAKWSNHGDAATNLSMATGLLLKSEKKGAVELIEQYHMGVEFCLGYGFGKRLVSINEVEVRPGGLFAKGTIRVFESEQNECELLVDKNGAVREAKVFVNLKWGSYKIESRSSGEFESKHLPSLASEGSFKKIMNVAGESSSSKEIENFSIKLLSVDHPLVDGKRGRG